MTRVFRWRWLSSTAAAWLVLMAVHAVAPATVQAGCNHPWVQVSGIAASVFDLELLESGIRPSLPASRSPQPLDRRGACVGGACSPSPEIPPISSVEAQPYCEYWGDLPAEPVQLLLRSRVSWPAEHDQRRPTRFHTPIERPPRLLAAF